MYEPFFEIEVLPTPKQPKKKYNKFIINSFFIGIFFSVLILGWLESRLMCHYNLPSDCRTKINTWNVYVDTTNILQKGSVIILISNFTENIKKINKWIKALYLGLFFVTGPIFALAGEFPGMQTSLATFTVGFNLSFIVYLSCLVITVLLLFYEFLKIFKYYGKFYLSIYGISRFLIILYYFVFSSILSKQNYHIHIHHLYIGFIIACLTHDHKWISGISLAIGSGIMVQGIGSYNYATIIQD